MSICKTCHGKGTVYRSVYNAGWYEPCPVCRPDEAPVWPDWMQPLGHSQITGPKVIGSEDEGVLDQT